MISGDQMIALSVTVLTGERMPRTSLVRIAVALMVAVASVGVGSTTAAAQPSNDDFTGATVIDGLPFGSTTDTGQATWDPDDPGDCSSNGSVWFAFTPSTDLTVQADTFGSSYDTVLSAWTGAQGSLGLVACNDDHSGGQSMVSFPATAGTTYYFMAARCCGSGGDGGGALRFSVTQLLPPANDDFVDATAIDRLPFSDDRSLGAASREAGEPESPCFSQGGTIWYSFTPSTSGSVTARVEQYGVGVAAYTGASLTDLSPVGCRDGRYTASLTFAAQAGTTYLFQVGQGCCVGAAPVTFRLDVAPSPVADLSFSPQDPNSFDTVRFYDYSHDPAGNEVSSWRWDLGDGTTSTDRQPIHRYAADGDYQVRLTVATPDGRTASVSRAVTVRTHDVSIVGLDVPTSARVGRTIDITVHVRNTRYPETVGVSLRKSTPGGFDQVGALTQAVAVKRASRSTPFAFSYTITSEDLAMGKITIQAEATITGYRDALPADNQLLSIPIVIR
ncbi:PKD domain-containing protein [Micromonospora sp. WMMD882]|uniref:PKD domain-containing protein n=1 Tax=Micromonospora sp. WMMD882 TaxID=3015151 RepID=UPI00248BCD0D|nr:PKD domain-containing protein [Micromonospora sp. WMMD882]WBB81620.1 PKD domain-containing protein [Micromonospora sp. WMMD882]